MEHYEHNTGTFIGKGGVEIFFQSWSVNKPKALLFIAHGLGEHSGRYMNIIEKLRGTGYSIMSLDHRGFGRSGGKMGHVDSFSDYLYDLKYYMNLVKEEKPGVPVILLGHSLGGVIACNYALNYPADIDGLILSAPALVLAMKVPAWKIKAGLFFSKYLPTLTMPNGLDPNLLSRDPEVVKAYIADPFVHDKVTARFYTEFVAAQEECLSRARELSMPLLVFHGDGDQTVSVEGSEIVFDRAATDKMNKQIKIFKGLYHETMNEVLADRDKVLDLVKGWLLKQAKAAPKKKPAPKAGSSGKAPAKKKKKK